METTIKKTFKADNVEIHILKSAEHNKGHYVVYSKVGADPITIFDKKVWRLETGSNKNMIRSYPVYPGLSYAQAEKRMAQMIQALNHVTFETIET